MNGLSFCVFKVEITFASAKVHDVVLFLYLFRSGNWVYTRTKTFCVCSCRGLLNLWPWHDPATQKGPPSTPPSHREQRAHSLFLDCPFPHTPHLGSQQSFKPPTSQGCLLPHLYKHRASCHHVANSARLRMLRVFNFLMRIVDLENSCYPRGHNTT